MLVKTHYYCTQALLLATHYAYIFGSLSYNKEIRSLIFDNEDISISKFKQIKTENLTKNNSTNWSPDATKLINVLLKLDDAVKSSINKLLKDHKPKRGEHHSVTKWHEQCDNAFFDYCKHIPNEDLIYILEDLDFLGCSDVIKRTLATLCFNRRAFYEQLRSNYKNTKNRFYGPRRRWLSTRSEAQKQQQFKEFTRAKRIYKELILDNLYSCKTLIEDNLPNIECLNWGYNEVQGSFKTHVTLHLAGCYLHSLKNLNELINSIKKNNSPIDEEKQKQLKILQDGPPEHNKYENIGWLKLNLSDNKFYSLHSKENSKILPEVYSIYINNRNTVGITSVKSADINWVKNKQYLEADAFLFHAYGKPYLKHYPTFHLYIYNGTPTGIDHCDYSTLSIDDTFKEDFDCKDYSYLKWYLKEYLKKHAFIIVPFIALTVWELPAIWAYIQRDISLISMYSTHISDHLQNIIKQSDIETVARVWKEMNLQNISVPFRHATIYNNHLSKVSYTIKPLDSTKWFSISNNLSKGIDNPYYQILSTPLLTGITFLIHFSISLGINKIIRYFQYFFDRDNFNNNQKQPDTLKNV